MKKIDEDCFFFLQCTIVWLAVAQVGGFGVLWADKFSKVGKDEENSARHSYLPERQVWCVRATEILSSGHTATHQHSTTPEHSTILAVNEISERMMRVAHANAEHGSVLKRCWCWLMQIASAGHGPICRSRCSVTVSSIACTVAGSLHAGLPFRQLSMRW